MTHLLRIDASARRDGSFTRRMADHFTDRWLAVHPQGQVTTRDLAQTDVPHISQETLAGFSQSEPTNAALALSDELIEELLSCDALLIASPLYNFGPPSALKAWVDLVARSGRTFDVRPEGWIGRMGGRNAYVLTACGAPEGMTERDAQVPWLRTVLGFLGFDRVDALNLGGTSIGDAGPAGLSGLEARFRALLRRVDELVQPLGHATPDPEWIGKFSSVDQREIDELRQAQMRCIEDGDAAGYAELCTDDVTLMLQGREPVLGRVAFEACERELLSGTGFRSLRQSPLRIERSGDLAFELGNQSLQIDSKQSREAAHYKPERKYTHILRKTDRGWRFAVLMSSSNS